jgi:PncC family amidohydrolase
MLILVKNFIYAYNMPMKSHEKVAKALIGQRKTLAIAESCTGGLISHTLTNIQGSSTFLKIGIIAYSNEAKVNILKVLPSTLKKHGAVSEQVAIEMAKGVRKLQKTDFGLSVTGIAGPTGGTKRKPIGLVYLAISTKNECLCLKCLFSGTRTEIKSKTTKESLNLLLEFLT